MDQEESFSVIFASPPDEEQIVADLYVQDQCVIELRATESEDFDVRFIDHRGQNLGEVKLTRLESMIGRAKLGLL